MSSRKIGGNSDVPTLNCRVGWRVPFQLLIPPTLCSLSWAICSQLHPSPSLVQFYTAGWCVRLLCLLPFDSFSKKHRKKIREWKERNQHISSPPCLTRKYLAVAGSLFWLQITLENPIMALISPELCWKLCLPFIPSTLRW